jgi:hypothetical protein
MDPRSRLARRPPPDARRAPVPDRGPQRGRSLDGRQQNAIGWESPESCQRPPLDTVLAGGARWSWCVGGSGCDYGSKQRVCI